MLSNVLPHYFDIFHIFLCARAAMRRLSTVHFVLFRKLADKSDGVLIIIMRLLPDSQSYTIAPLKMT